MENLQATKLTLGDLIVIFALIGIGLNLLMGRTQASPAQVIITSTDRQITRIDITEERIIEVEGKLGKSVIEVADGKVRFVNSPCPHHLCMKRGWIDMPGDWIACVPNGILVRISGESGFDAVTP